MSTTIKRARVATPAAQTEQKTDFDTKGERGQPQDAKTLRRLSIETIGLAAVFATMSKGANTKLHRGERRRQCSLKLN